MADCPPHDFEQEDLLLVCKRCGDVDLGLMRLALTVRAKLETMGVTIVDDSPDAPDGR